MRPEPGSEAFVAHACEQAQRMIREQASRGHVLEHLVASAEAVHGGGAVVSILLLDGEGLLRNGASPNLPADYLAAIDRLKPDPKVGTCAAAAATGKVVVTEDFLSDEKWAELRHLPLALGFVSAWSMPIKSDAGRVLGTMGTYFRDRRTPTAREREAVRAFASAAAEAVQSAGGTPA
jgi:GAF domain-containing protein